jgi:hypothetical protein
VTGGGAPRRVYLLTRDLVFRGKLGGLVAVAGGEVTRDAAACELAVIELGAAGWEERVRELTGRGIPTVAFGPHVDAEPLRRVRAAGGTAVPNSQVESTVRSLLETQATPGNPGSPT